MVYKNGYEWIGIYSVSSHIWYINNLICATHLYSN